ncbi:MAG: hypothetical protein M1550_03605 [Deltaproteobacteria bacterium]|nr:hypothetical protein [Deltaproteobacteria bacterium]
MKKLLTVLVVAMFALSVAGLAFAAEKAAPAAPAKPAAEKKAEPKAEKKVAKKAKPKFVTGTIEALDAAAGTLTVKGKKESISLKAGEKVKLEGFKVGEKVTVKYSDGTALSVLKPKAKKAAHKAEKKAEKKAEPAKPAEKK